MLSKNPLDLPKDRKLGPSEVAQALRLGIIAELDAINLYYQLANSIEREDIRKVFEDIAKEEKTHVGEFLTLLKSVDPEQIEELKAGSSEVAELTGIKVQDDPPSDRNASIVEHQTPEMFKEDEWASLLKAFKDAFTSSRKLRDAFTSIELGEGVEAIPLEVVEVGDLIKSASRKLIPLKELSVKFSIAERDIASLRRLGKTPISSSTLYAASRLGRLEDEFLLKGDEESGIPGLLTFKDSLKLDLSDWGVSGSAVNNVANAISELAKVGAPEPYVLVLNPVRYADLVSVHERTGVMELNRIKALVNKVITTTAIPPDKVIVLSANSSAIDIVVGTDLRVDYLGPEDSQHVFRAWETIAPRIKLPYSIALLEKK